jgi:hypothetical protein
LSGAQVNLGCINRAVEANIVAFGNRNAVVGSVCKTAGIGNYYLAAIDAESVLRNKANQISLSVICPKSRKDVGYVIVNINYARRKANLLKLALRYTTVYYRKRDFRSAVVLNVDCDFIVSVR